MKPVSVFTTKTQEEMTQRNVASSRSQSQTFLLPRRDARRGSVSSPAGSAAKLGLETTGGIFVVAVQPKHKQEYSHPRAVSPIKHMEKYRTKASNGKIEIKEAHARVR